MDTRDGRIYEARFVETMPMEDAKYLTQMQYNPTPTQRARGRVGRNDTCPCGSGKKFKKCCIFRKALP